MGSDGVYIDVTATYFSNRLTGVQKVVRDIVQDPGQYQLVVYDRVHACYRGVSHLPSPSLSNSVKLHWPPKKLLLDAAGTIANTLFRQVFVGVYGGLWGFIRAVLGASKRSGQKVGEDDIRNKQIVTLHEIREIWLLDIPAEESHLSFLESAVSQGVRLRAYVYDLIPLEKAPRASRARATRASEYRRYLDLVLKAVSVATLTESSRDELHSFVLGRGRQVQKPPKIGVLYPPRPDNVEGFRPIQSESHRALKLRESRRIILMIAPLTPRKNHSVLVRAVKELVSAGEDLCLVLVSPSSLEVSGESVRELIRFWVRFPDRLRFVRPVSEDRLADLYRLASVVAVPSTSEGLGLPLLEAARSGKPVVASPIPAFIEASRICHINFAEDSNVSSWIDALHGALLNKGPVGLSEQYHPVSSSQFLRSFGLLDHGESHGLR